MVNTECHLARKLVKNVAKNELKVAKNLPEIFHDVRNTANVLVCCFCLEQEYVLLLLQVYPTKMRKCKIEVIL